MLRHEVEQIYSTDQTNGSNKRIKPMGLGTHHLRPVDRFRRSGLVRSGLSHPLAPRMGRAAWLPQRQLAAAAVRRRSSAPALTGNRLERRAQSNQRGPEWIVCHMNPSRVQHQTIRPTLRPRNRGRAAESSREQPRAEKFTT